MAVCFIAISPRQGRVTWWKGMVEQNHSPHSSQERGNDWEQVILFKVMLPGTHFLQEGPALTYLLINGLISPGADTFGHWGSSLQLMSLLGTFCT